MASVKLLSAEINEFGGVVKTETTKVSGDLVLSTVVSAFVTSDNAKALKSKVGKTIDIGNATATRETWTTKDGNIRSSFKWR